MRAGRLAERPYDVPQRIVIPNLTGMIVPAALRSADDVGFTLASADPMMRLTDVASSGRWQVAEQEPVGGATRFRGDTVAVTFRRDHRGPDAGDREPRNPLPPVRVESAPLPQADALDADVI
jgi:hypothetical protein